jgi:hypothetical protein
MNVIFDMFCIVIKIWWYFKNLSKKCNICAFRILFTKGNGNQYLFTTQKRFTRVSQNEISINLAKKKTRTFLLPLPQTKMDINVFMGNWCWVILISKVYYDPTNWIWNHINQEILYCYLKVGLKIFEEKKMQWLGPFI